MVHNKKNLEGVPEERDNMQKTTPANDPSGRSGIGVRRVQRRAGKREPWIKWLLIAVITPIILAIISTLSERSKRPIQETGQSPDVIVVSTTQPAVNVMTSLPDASTGQLEGILTDRKGKTISDMTVSVRNGSETVTDARGVFVLSGVLTGNQLLVVRSLQDGGREWTQHVSVLTNRTTKVNIAYDPMSSRLGLLLITAPVDDGILEVKQVGQQFLAEVYGRCNGLDNIFGSKFDIWVVIRSQLDQRLWVQHPPALVDLTAGTWKANVQIGSSEAPPRNGEQWDIIAVAAPASSDIKRILNIMSLSDLPEHIRANFITITTRVK